MSSLEEADRASAAVATAPRVSLVDIKMSVLERYDLTADQAVNPESYQLQPHPHLGILSICILVMKNGFVVIGKAAPASPENFSVELGRKLAYEDAIRQLWPLMGYALKERLTKGSDAA